MTVKKRKKKSKFGTFEPVPYTSKYIEPILSTISTLILEADYHMINDYQLITGRPE
jgi:hypothetical protein